MSELHAKLRALLYELQFLPHASMKRQLCQMAKQMIEVVADFHCIYQFVSQDNQFEILKPAMVHGLDYRQLGYKDLRQHQISHFVLLSLIHI